MNRVRNRPREDAPATRAATDWRRWMAACGSRVRAVRMFLGLSQERLAAIAGVSQGAVSRLEMARGLATPLLVVLRIDQALRQELGRLDPQVLTAELRWALRRDALLFAPLEARPDDEAHAPEPELEELVRLYREIPEAFRPGLLAIVRAAVPGLRRTARPVDPE
jgi:transcriptional regulator with XRE-family HTH domain